MSRKNIVFWVVALVVIALDQATKIWVYTNVQFGVEEIEVIPGFFSIVHAQNPGAALGILRDFEYRIWLFLGFTVLAMGILLNMQRQLAKNLSFLPTVLGMIFGGAVGNGIDRVHKQSVTDFLRFYTEAPALKTWLIDWFGTNEYPSFNVADMALVIGVGLFVVHYLFLDEGELDGKKPDAEEGEDEGNGPPQERTA